MPNNEQDIRVAALKKENSELKTRIAALEETKIIVESENAALKTHTSTLEREKERLIHSLRKSEQCANRALESDGQSKQYAEALDSMWKSAANSNKEVVTLLREAKTKAEEAEKTAKVAENTAQEEVCRLRKALISEKQHLKNESERYLAEVRRVKLELRDKEASARIVFEKLNKELKQARAEVQTARDREAKMFDLAKSSSSLASGVVQHSQNMGECLKDCFQNLAAMISSATSTTWGLSSALDASRQGVQLVLSERGDTTKCEFLSGTEYSTRREITAGSFEMVGPFLGGIDVVQAQQQAQDATKTLVKRKLTSQGGQADETGLLNWCDLYEDLLWTPLSLLTKQEFVKCLIDYVHSAQVESVSKQLTQLQLSMATRTDALRYRIKEIKKSHEFITKFATTSEEEHQNWQKKEQRLSLQIKAAEEDGENTYNSPPSTRTSRAPNTA